MSFDERALDGPRGGLSATQQALDAQAALLPYARAGPAREPLLMTAVAASVVIIFFASPWLPSLLIVGPAAAAGPLLCLMLRPETQELGRVAWGAVALAMALALIFNRVLRRLFA